MEVIISIFLEFSKDQQRLNVDEVVAAMCLLCHDPADQRMRAALHIFQRTRKANEQFTHADLVQLFSSGVLMFSIDNSFDIGTEEEEEEEEDLRIHVRRRLSQDDSSQHSVGLSLRIVI